MELTHRPTVTSNVFETKRCWHSCNTVEIQLCNDVSLDDPSLCDEIEKFFSLRTLRYHEQELRSEDLCPELASYVTSIRLTDLQQDTELESRPGFFWWEIRPKFHFFKMSSAGPKKELDEDENISFSQEWTLPCMEFRDVWDSLYFEDNIKMELFQYIKSALVFFERGVNPDIISWNRLILLHGPPGTGKTSLCKALAQKVAIRLYSKFPEGIRLIEVNAQSLFSKWFSESSKLVSMLFERIQDSIQSPNLMLFVLIDEIESLVTNRTSCVQGSEPLDALRAVNALLTQIDRLKRYPNVVILTTSNVTEALDSAFIDRADIKAFVGPPGLTVRRQILEKSMQELFRVGIIASDEKQHSYAVDRADIVKSMKSDLTLEDNSTSGLLQSCSVLSEGMSCRSLKKLPFLAYVFMAPTRAMCVSYTDFLKALRESITKTNHEKTMIEY